MAHTQLINEEYQHPIKFLIIHHRKNTTIYASNVYLFVVKSYNLIVVFDGLFLFLINTEYTVKRKKGIAIIKKKLYDIASQKLP